MAVHKVAAEATTAAEAKQGNMCMTKKAAKKAEPGPEPLLLYSLHEFVAGLLYTRRTAYIYVYVLI